ncbi:hypothetical protein NEMIN01_1159 [Nematocida minor]|uniref:uncharacterized protein n=1 Tax=Nematocida minor TaxID=1912983 RepID=UPI002220EC25|nr:uncharacterized protein NEMIN01_1159 [Nematocida minor]KAI5190694.1 hypothetical protein NEMIN01_1159 [Nematocida minor]
MTRSRNAKRGLFLFYVPRLLVVLAMLSALKGSSSSDEQMVPEAAVPTQLKPDAQEIELCEGIEELSIAKGTPLNGEESSDEQLVPNFVDPAEPSTDDPEAQLCEKVKNLSVTREGVPSESASMDLEDSSSAGKDDDGSEAVNRVLDSVIKDKAEYVTKDFWYLVAMMGDRIEERGSVLKKILKDFKKYEAKLRNIPGCDKFFLFQQLSLYLYYPEILLSCDTKHLNCNLLANREKDDLFANLSMYEKHNDTLLHSYIQLPPAKDKITSCINAVLQAIFNIPEIRADCKKIEGFKTFGYNLSDSLDEYTGFSSETDDEFFNTMALNISNYREKNRYLCKFTNRELFAIVNNVHAIIKVNEEYKGMENKNRLNPSDKKEATKWYTDIIYKVLIKKYAMEDGEYNIDEIYNDMYRLFGVIYKMNDSLIDKEDLIGLNAFLDDSIILHSTSSILGEDVNRYNRCRFQADHVLNCEDNCVDTPYYNIHFYSIEHDKYYCIPMPVTRNTLMTVNQMIRYLKSIYSLGSIQFILPMQYCCSSKTWSSVPENERDKRVDYMDYMNTLVFYYSNAAFNPLFSQYTYHLVEANELKRPTNGKYPTQLNIPMFFSPLDIESVKLANFTFKDTKTATPPENSAIENLKKEIKKMRPLVLEHSGRYTCADHYNNLVIDRADDSLREQKNTGLNLIYLENIQHPVGDEVYIWRRYLCPYKHYVINTKNNEKNRNIAHHLKASNNNGLRVMSFVVYDPEEERYFTVIKTSTLRDGISRMLKFTPTGAELFRDHERYIYNFSVLGMDEQTAMNKMKLHQSIWEQLTSE